MMKQSPNINILFEDFVQALPDDYQQMAYQFGAFCRPRKVRSVYQLLQLVSCYCHVDFSLRSCAAQFACMQGYLSDTAVHKRLKNCVPWVKAMLACVIQSEKINIAGHLRLIAIDASTVQVPGATGTSYRLHIAMNLNTLELLDVTVTTDKQGENLFHYALQEGDIVVVDRGYNQPRSLVPFIDGGGSVVLRYNPHGMNLYQQNESMDKIDWFKTLRQKDAQMHAVPVYIKYETVRVKGFIHAIPLPSEQAEQARRRVRDTAKKKGYTPSAASLYLCTWVLIFDNLPLALLDTEAISNLYRVRWQVELLIKRLKSILNIDMLRAKKDSLLAELYLHGKLLYAAVVDKLARRHFGMISRTLIDERTHTPWRLWTLLASQLNASLMMAMPIQAYYANDCIKALCERPRKRRLQSLPTPVTKLVFFCRDMGVSNV
jgi:hypothetical protein